MSGHFATLLRGTVEALLPHHDVYITDWMDARHVPTKEGRFNLDNYIAYVMEFIRFLGAETHVIAVCQPAVPVLAATALMESLNDPLHPRSITLMGGPIDPRVSKTEVTELAESRPLSWFENTVVTEVPFYYAGAYRSVYPGFLQLSGFMSMNLDRHVGSHIQFYNHLIDGDGESAEFHRKFYDEYMAVMDITAEFYLQTVETVFQRHLLPKGKMKWRDPETEILHDVDLTKIKKTAILTIEGENDDISAYGQTSATHALCENLKPTLKYHHFAENVGHYGIFNGRRWREQIMPRIRAFARSVDQTGGLDPVPATDIAAMKNPEKHNKMPEKWDAEKFSVKAIKAFSHAKKKALEKQQKQQEKSAEFTAEKTEREES
jgi:poly(3-hydroxybutyrate) depolymerase